MLKEAIILAGGLGTRLRSVIKDIPKPMAPINGKPFLEYILGYLSVQGIRKIILAVGYKAEIIKNYFGKYYNGTKLQYSEEKELLDTGGAIRQALKFSEGADILIVNGDSFFNIDLDVLYKFHIKKKADLTIALKRMKRIKRYGTVKINEDGKIIGFFEKKYVDEGLINGGIYILNRHFFQSLNLPDKFSFEKDFLEKYYNLFNFYGMVFDSYFIDIGVPEDYEKAKKERMFYDSLQK